MDLEPVTWKNTTRIGNLPSVGLSLYALEKKGAALIVARDDREMAELAAMARFFAPDRDVLEFPAWDIRPFDRISPHPSIASERAGTLAQLASATQIAPVILTTERALLQTLPPKAVFEGASLSLRLGQVLDLEELQRFTRAGGYHHVPTVRAVGEYALRGGIVDIFPAGLARPIRADLFGEEIDSLREFDPETQRSGAKLGALDLAPSGELVLNEERIANFRNAYRAIYGVPKRDDPYYEAVSTGMRPQGVEQFLPLFYGEMTSLADYLPPDCHIYLREGAFENLAAISSEIKRRAETVEGAKALFDLHYLSPEKLASAFSKQKSYIGIYGNIPTGANAIDAGFRPARDFAPERSGHSGQVFSSLGTHLNALQKTAPVLIATISEGSAERMRTMLAEYEIGHAKRADTAQDIEAGLNVGVLPIAQGVSTKSLHILSESDILGARLGRKRKKRKSAENVLSEAAQLSVGDLIVHRDHGIGRFLGMETVHAAGAPHECLVLEYAGGNKLFLPVENIDLISPYGEESGSLDKLGASNWQERKARAKKDLLAMADGLIKLAAERNLRRAPIMHAEPAEYDAFAAGFPFEETDDQLLAIEETLADLASGRVMDRLVCGDVGFGKTEVALRAAFVAASAGHQVALIAPTTLLARQHTRNFRERFAGTPIRVEQLSRFVSAQNTKLRKTALERGEIDIIIGTHALLARDVRFKDLGLLIIDEEQHFGVKHKEKIKALRADVHVLTLSATPIPRTLQLALSGVRELSLIATPPTDRLAVRTYLAPFDGQMIRDALLQEKLRGGQSFYVVPRVADIPDIEEFLAENCPDLRVIVAHGQLPSGELDGRVNDFYDGKADVLLATTIIESGLDIPTANTLIVHRADMFGLAQLYQIRGRVGRAKLRAFAYLTTKKGAALNPAAEKRLRVLTQLDELGSGFSLAAHDLDLRGAGNLLGEEQSGQIKEIGFALYQSMLKDAIKKLKAGDLALNDDSQEWSPEISLGVAVMIPEDYVSDLDTRLSLYRRIANLRKKSEIEEFAAEMIDRFGKLPPEVETLFQLVNIKANARIAGISSFEVGPRGATLRFHRNSFANPKGLVDFIAREKGRTKVKDTRIIVSRDWPDDAARIQGARNLAIALAKLARDA